MTSQHEVPLSPEPADIDWSAVAGVDPAPKKAVSLRLDSDVLGYFKSSGRGYQTRINAVLRHYMEAVRAQKGTQL